nr:slit homolog 1 protein [Ciona intestinalis]|eukprot:XP_002125744.3 slit homolog 1 protein [Ciona intestinalis]
MICLQVFAILLFLVVSFQPTLQQGQRNQPTQNRGQQPQQQQRPQPQQRPQNRQPPPQNRWPPQNRRPPQRPPNQPQHPRPPQRRPPQRRPQPQPPQQQNPESQGETDRPQNPEQNQQQPVYPNTPRRETVCTRICYCQQSQAYCAQKQLRRIPEPWPYGLTSISLDQNRLTSINIEALSHSELRSVASFTMAVNQITKIPNKAFTGLTSVRELTLSSNLISEIESEAFQGLHSVETINLRKNELSNLDPTPFARLRSLRMLNLEGNKLETLDASFFDKLPNLAALALGDNPWKCDCNLLGLFMWIYSGKQLQGKAPTCWSPEEHQGKNLQAVTFIDFQKICLDEWKDEAKDDITGPPEIEEVISKINDSCSIHNATLPVDICFISNDVYTSPGRHVCIHCLSTKDERLFEANGSGVEAKDFTENSNVYGDVNITWDIPDVTGDDVRIVQHENGSLCIQKVRVSDAGEYVCSAELNNITVFETVNIAVSNAPLTVAVSVIVVVFLLIFIFILILLRWWHGETEATQK